MRTYLQGIGYLPQRQYENDTLWEAHVFKLSKNCRTVKAGYALELLCKFQFDGDKFSFDWFKRNRKTLRKKGLIYITLTVDVWKEINTPYLLSNFDTCYNPCFVKLR